jgi:membrane protein DedA with SNARE-associated domain
MIQELVSFCQELVVAIGYPGVILVAVLENFFPPLPSEVIFPFVGFVAAQGGLSLSFVIAAGVIGTYVGALFWYLAGLWLGSDRLKKLIVDYGKPLHIGLKDIERAEHWFERYEMPVVFFARLIPLVRTFISVPAGFVKMNFFVFSFLTLLGSSIWIGLLSYAGFVFETRWEAVVPYFERYEMAALAVTVIAVVLFFIKKIKNRHL